MTGPLPLETILSEFDEDYEAWVLQDRESAKYVVIPDDRFPGRRPIRFFMRREDAESVRQELLEQNISLRDRDIYPVKVPLRQALRSIAADTTPGNVDAFVFHSPNEVYEWVRNRT
ncbi:MAG: hypothetical protein ACHQ4J_12185 [Candidatus Binatia bacterium]